MGDTCDVCGTLIGEHLDKRGPDHVMHHDCFQAFVGLKHLAVGYDIEPRTLIQTWGTIERMHAGALDKHAQAHYRRAAATMQPALTHFREGKHGSV